MVLSVLLALTVIIITARLTGRVFSKLDLPAVIGEVDHRFPGAPKAG